MYFVVVLHWHQTTQKGVGATAMVCHPVFEKRKKLYKETLKSILHRGQTTFASAAEGYSWRNENRAKEHVQSDLTPHFVL